MWLGAFVKALIRIRTYNMNRCSMGLSGVISFALLMLGALAFVFLMLLPAFLELKRPKDAGPRIIAGCSQAIGVRIEEISIANIEKEERYDQALSKKIAVILSVFPNLET
jgi:hypothetical protein